MQSLIRHIDEVAQAADFSGVVSIYQADAPLHERAFGYRDMQNQLPNQVDTCFGTASGTKLFTALGIGRLIDQGVIELDTQVGDLCPDYTGFIDPHATIHHLLTHTSGIYDYYDEEVEQDFDHCYVGIPWYDLETPGDYWPLFQGQALKFRPGERFSYSNGGYVFLALLIERLTDTLYRDFVQAQVLQVAHMPRSGFYAMNQLPANTANGYLQDRETTNIFNLPIRGGGDGGLFTTAQDLRSLWQHLIANQILSPELTTAFLRTHHRFTAQDGYGCGIYKRLDNSMYAIVGGDAGVGFDSRYLADRQITVSILSNITNGENALRKAVMDFFDKQA